MYTNTITMSLTTPRLVSLGVVTVAVPLREGYAAEKNFRALQHLALAFAIREGFKINHVGGRVRECEKYVKVFAINNVMVWFDVCVKTGVEELPFQFVKHFKASEINDAVHHAITHGQSVVVTEFCGVNEQPPNNVKGLLSEAMPKFNGSNPEVREVRK